MSKQSGIGDRLLVGGVDLSGDIGAIGSAGGGPALIDVTAINQGGHDRRGGLLDGRLEFTSFFDPATGAAHLTLGALPTGLLHVLYGRGAAIGSPGAGLVARQVNYDPSRGADGSVTMAISAQAAAGFALEWGQLLTAITRTDVAATDGAGLDNATSSALGLVAYLQVLALTGTDVTVALEHSTDDNTYAAVTGGGFTQVTAAPATERIATAADATINRYLRVATTGTFTSATFAVLVKRG